MAETARKYQKAGYQDSLLFDPARGIIKYGSYEFFADQVGVKPQTQTFKFSDYQRSFAPKPGDAYAALSPFGRMNETQMREQFAKDVQSGALRPAPKPTGMWAALYDATRAPAYERVIDPSATASPWDSIGYKAPSPYRNVQQADADTYSVTTYDIPKGIEFVNKLNAMASNLAANAAQGQVTDANRPNPKNARLQKPNYARAATVLTGGALAHASASTLGATSTLLGTRG